MELNRREEVIKLAAKIASLRQTLVSVTAELSTTESALDELIAAPLPQALKPNAGESLLAGIEAPNERSLNRRIVDLIEASCHGPSDDFDADGVLVMLGEANITSIRSGLARLADQNKIRRTTRGRYGSMRFATATELLAAS
jgi:hypothetical protein